MKTAFLLTLVLAFSAHAKFEEHLIECRAMTWDRDVYNVTAKFIIESNLMKCNPPCMVDVKEATAEARLEVFRKGRVIHDKITKFPNFVLHINPAQTIYQFYDGKDFFLDIVPWVGDMNKIADIVRFQLGIASGSFNNAVCSFRGPDGKARLN